MKFGDISFVHGILKTDPFGEGSFIPRQKNYLSADFIVHIVYRFP